jgi:hypothetical protein
MLNFLFAQNNKFAKPVSVLLTIFSTAYAAIQFPQVPTSRPLFFVIQPFFQITSDAQTKSDVSMSQENNATRAAYRQDADSAQQLVEHESKGEATPYSYPKFHVAFCFASCFLSMQLSNWLERCMRIRALSAF